MTKDVRADAGFLKKLQARWPRFRVWSPAPPRTHNPRERQLKRIVRHSLLAGIQAAHPHWARRSSEHFLRRQDFLTVIDRCEKHQCGFHGVEVFDSGGQMLVIEIAPEPGAAWARPLTEQWTAKGLLFSATIYTPLA
jgi:hypothetical protein